MYGHSGGQSWCVLVIMWIFELQGRHHAYGDLLRPVLLVSFLSESCVNCCVSAKLIGICQDILVNPAVVSVLLG